MILVAMGVCGSGKTTIGVLLAERLGWAFYDADNFHSEANKRKMNQGIPLTDEDRIPWLHALQSQLRESDAKGESMILACSALKEAFRDALAEAAPEVQYLYLEGDASLISERLEERKDHYMNPDLLDSQFEALESPNDAYRVDISPEPEEIVDRMLSDEAFIKRLPEATRRRLK